jgi:hypothetical protein
MLILNGLYVLLINMTETSEMKMFWGQLLRLEWKHNQEAKMKSCSQLRFNADIVQKNYFN